MIRNLLATTAFATLVATSAYAQQDPAAPTNGSCRNRAARRPRRSSRDMKSDGHLATNIIGENVYNGTGDNAVKHRRRQRHRHWPR